MDSQVGFVRELRVTIAAVVALILVGTAGYVVLEGWSPLDAFYMTVITVFTVGFREVHELSPVGQIFTAVLIMFGVGIALWAGAGMLELVLSPEARDAIRIRRMRKAISAMEDHYIICGFGRIGKEVCAVLRERGTPHAVGDTDEAAVAELTEEECPFVIGDCSEDDILRSLGIERARGLIAVAGSDADNTFIVLSARSIRPDLHIVARAATPEARRKLETAGADRVITPYEIGGRRIASLAIQPGIVDFLDVVTKGDTTDLAIDEVRVRESSELVGATLRDARIREVTGAHVLAIRSHDGRLNTHPSDGGGIMAGDVLIALGTCDQLSGLAQLAGGR